MIYEGELLNVETTKFWYDVHLFLVWTPSYSLDLQDQILVMTGEYIACVNS